MGVISEYFYWWISSLFFGLSISLSKCLLSLIDCFFIHVHKALDQHFIQVSVVVEKQNECVQSQTNSDTISHSQSTYWDMFGSDTREPWGTACPLSRTIVLKNVSSIGCVAQNSTEVNSSSKMVDSTDCPWALFRLLWVICPIHLFPLRSPLCFLSELMTQPLMPSQRKREWK